MSYYTTSGISCGVNFLYIDYQGKEYPIESIRTVLCSKFSVFEFQFDKDGQQANPPTAILRENDGHRIKDSGKPRCAHIVFSDSVRMNNGRSLAKFIEKNNLGELFK